MKVYSSLFYGFLFSFICTHLSFANTASAYTYVVAQPIPDRTVSFNTQSEGTPHVILWGLDTAWPSEDNMRRGIAFMGKETLDLVRISFQPTRELINGEFQEGSYLGDDNEIYQSQSWWLDTRLSYVKLISDTTPVMINSDHPFVASWYTTGDAATIAARWEQLIWATTKYTQEKGHPVITVAPFNEPDYTYTGQGTMSNFNDIAARIKANPNFDGIRVSGGNTLNCDAAHTWYDYLKNNLDEGNTHQLAGTFDNYASFFEKVRANGDYATADELHNVMEAMVGVEYGMQTGIWWGTAEYARGEYCKATRKGGARLGYSEHRPNWTAAAVYRAPDGKIQGFVGSSERQATTTTYRFFAEDMPVYYDGYGPQYEYIMELASGEPDTYQTSLHTSGERVINIHTGDDVPAAPIDGKYLIVNRESGKVMEIRNNASSMNEGATVRQYAYTSASTNQQWSVTPVSNRVGGDFSYFTFLSELSGKALDVVNFSLAENATISVYNDNKNGAQQFYLEYAGDGYYYIRSRHSAKCVQASRSNNIVQGEKLEGESGYHQQWRFISVNVSAVDFELPTTPTDLTATTQSASVYLSWLPSAEVDVTGYNIYRAQSVDGVYQTIARNVVGTNFVDNTAMVGINYFYKIKAIDEVLNRSEYSNVASATILPKRDLVARLHFNDNLLDSTSNANHASIYGTANFIEGKIGSKALSLNGNSHFLQMPSHIASHDSITISTWVYSRKSARWQRIFDFGNGEDQYMFLTPRNGSSKVSFAIKNGGDELQLVGGSAVPLNSWVHVAVTIAGSSACLYVDGELVDSSDSFTISPADIMPKLNYLGRSQFSSDPLFSGYLDDFRVYNYALSASEIGLVMNNDRTLSSLPVIEDSKHSLFVWPSPAIDVLHVSCNGIEQAILAVYDVQGKFMGSYELKNGHAEINVSGFSSGNYVIKYTDKENTLTKQFIVK